MLALIQIHDYGKLDASQCAHNMSGASSRVSVDGFEASFENGNCLVLVSKCEEILINLLKMDGFENSSFKIDGFDRTHRTHADEAPA